MRPLQNVEKWLRLRKPRMTTSNQMDERVLDDSFAAMDQVRHAQSTDGEPKAWSIIVRSRMTKFAAALIVIAIGLLVIHSSPRPQPGTDTVPREAKSAGEMMTAMSLRIAYRRGGLEAVDKQCDKAFSMLGLETSRISIRELLRESNGEGPERKEL
jgi:hypothetical protein